MFIYLSCFYRDRLKEDSFCDVTVLVDGHEFPAHKFMLGNFSLFFRKKFKDEAGIF